ncbi:MAG TPA: DUF6516 family protein [Desulfatiglandales bacterium]|nr:DUF6516 family protein [Desulfatiglandales bacterium]
MLRDALVHYLEDIESAVRELNDVYVEHYEEEYLASDRVNLRIRIRFATGYLLELNEAAILEGGNIRHLGYRYHFQDTKNQLIFRYDNTPHYPNLKSFPHHKHAKRGVIAVEKPSIPNVLEEVKSIAQPAE